jgi:hypothetical protein
VVASGRRMTNRIEDELGGAARYAGWSAFYNVRREAQR